MPLNVELIARLAHIDEKLDDMHTELGDLPKLVKKLEDKLRQHIRLVEETQKSLEDVVRFRATKVVPTEEKTKKI